MLEIFVTLDFKSLFGYRFFRNAVECSTIELNELRRKREIRARHFTSAEKWPILQFSGALDTKYGVPWRVWRNRSHGALRLIICLLWKSTGSERSQWEKIIHTTSVLKRSDINQKRRKTLLMNFFEFTNPIVSILNELKKRFLLTVSVFRF